MCADRAVVIEVLAPHDVEAGQCVKLSADPPTYDWRHLAAMISSDHDRVNSELNGIYIRAAMAEMREREPEAKYTKRRLARLWKAYDDLPSPALRILAAEVREALSEGGVRVPSNIADKDLESLLAAALIRARAAKPSKPLGPPGVGARVRLALCELVNVFCRETGSGLPYNFAKRWVKLAPIEFAVTVLREWELEPPKRPFDTQKLASVWHEARKKTKSGNFGPT
jgi:hypothetical protein